MSTRSTDMLCISCRVYKSRSEFAETTKPGPRRCLTCLESNDSPSISQRQKRQRVFNQDLADIRHNQTVVDAWIAITEG